MRGSLSRICLLSQRKDDIQRTMDRVVIGDSTDSEGVMTEFWSSLREAGTRAHPPVAMLHLDPARPQRCTESSY